MAQPRGRPVARPPWSTQLFWDEVAQLQAGDASAIERALLFLEDDPWSMGSGYAKEHVVRVLARHQFDPEQQRRLASVLLYLVDIGDRWEFRWYCRLARRVPVALLRDELVDRLGSNYRGVSRRALWMLAALRHPQLTDEQLTAVRAAIVRLTATRPSSSWSRSTRNLVVRFWSLEWEKQLIELSRGTSVLSTPATRVLGQLPRLHSDVDPVTLATIEATKMIRDWEPVAI